VILEFLSMYTVNHVPRSDVDAVLVNMQIDEEFPFWIYDVMSGELDLCKSEQFFQAVGGVLPPAP